MGYSAPDSAAIKIAMKGLAGGPNNDNIRIVDLMVTPTIAMGYSVDISSYGFSSITNVMAIAERDTIDPMQVINVGVKSRSTSAVVFNLTQGSTAVVTLLGINVLSGPPIVPATGLSNVTLHIRVEGT